MIGILLTYFITFVGGVLLSYVAMDLDWRERVLCGLVNALICGTILFLTLTILTTLGLS